MKILQLASIVLIFSGMSLHAQDAESKVAAALKGKIIGITDGKAVDVELKGSPEYYVFYYSASWWGSCAAVTKQLASINQKNLQLGEKSKFQLVLFGFDSSEEANANYMKKKGINFPGVKLAAREALAPLLEKGDTGFIPNLILLKPDGEFVTNDQEKVIKLLAELAP